MGMHSTALSRAMGAAIMSLVERQEVRGAARQPCGHEHLFGVHGKVNQRPALELKQRLAVIAVLLILRNGVAHRLPCHGVFQLGCDKGDAVER